MGLSMPLPVAAVWRSFVRFILYPAQGGFRDISVELFLDAGLGASVGELSGLRVFFDVLRVGLAGCPGAHSSDDGTVERAPHPVQISIPVTVSGAEATAYKLGVPDQSSGALDTSAAVTLIFTGSLASSHSSIVSTTRAS